MRNALPFSLPKTLKILAIIGSSWKVFNMKERIGLLSLQIVVWNPKEFFLDISWLSAIGEKERGKDGIHQYGIK